MKQYMKRQTSPNNQITINRFGSGSRFLTRFLRLSLDRFYVQGWNFVTLYFSFDKNIKKYNSSSMKYQSSDIFNSKNIKSSIHQQNSSFSSPYQSKHPKQTTENDSIRILTIKTTGRSQKQKVYFRSNLTVQYIPEFRLISQTEQSVTIMIKEYSLQLLPWLIKKDSLFKINLILGIYIAILQLIDTYGLFPIHPNMMRVNERQQVAVWINKNFDAFKPDQILTKNAFSMKQFIRSFLRIMKCCLPSKKMSDMYNQPKQLLNQLVKIKRRQEIHKNCHEFLKHDQQITSSRRQIKCNSNLLLQSKKQILQKQRYSTHVISKINSISKRQNVRLSSFSPPRNSAKKTSLQKRFSKTNGFKNEKNPYFIPHLFKKKSQITLPARKLSSLRQENNQVSISSNGDLFKRYLMYNTTKFQKMSKISHHYTEISSNSFNQKGLIFRSEVHRLNDNVFSQTIIQEQNPFQFMSQNKIQEGSNSALFSPIKFRKMSSNTNQKKADLQNKFINSGGWRRTKQQEQDNFGFGCHEREESAKTENKQKLKNSFPYKTASTLTSFRLSNQHQNSIFPSRSEQNLNNTLNSCLVSAPVVLMGKQKDKQIEQMKIEQQNQLQSDLNNIFSMQNSHIKNQEEQKRLEMIMSQFQQVLF